MAKQKSLWLARGLIYAPFKYTLCLTQKRFDKLLDQLELTGADRPSFIGTPQAGATAHQFRHFGGQWIIVVTLQRPKGVTRSQVYALLAHEAMHMWRAMREDIGEHSPSAEFEAYALQAFVQELINSYDEQVAKPKKKARTKKAAVA